MPVSATRSSKLLGEVDGVLAGQRVGDEQRLVRRARSSAISAVSAISASSIWVRPAVSSSSTS